MYFERPSEVADAVAWRSTTSAPSWVLPDGCMDLLWFNNRLMIAGPDTTAHGSDSPVGGVLGLRLAPGVMPGLLGMPAVELRDRLVPLDEAWPDAEAREVNERVGSAADRLVALESVAGALLRQAPPDRLMRDVAHRLEAGSSVRALADHAGLSERQLHRRSLVAYGYGPKTLGRILRLQRALALARSGTDFATCAHQAGYVDQAHLARDVRELAGTTLTELIAERSSQPSGAKRSTWLPSGSEMVA